MTLPSPPDQPQPATQTRQTSLKWLKLPLTVEHFRSLGTSEQNNLIAEQVMQWKLYEWEDECSSVTPGATWQNGSDYYALECSLWAPAYLDEVLAENEMALEDWAESYGSRDWVHDIGAAMKLLEQLADQQPAVYKHTPNEPIPWEWYCRVFRPDHTSTCWHGANTFEELPTAIAITCLEDIGVIDNRPLANTPAIEELVLQAASQGPAPSHNVHSRYCHRNMTWVITETSHTLDGEDTDHWQVQYRNGHYVFHPV